MLATLEQIKNRLGITSADTGDDEQLTAWLLMVSARFNRYCRRQFIRNTNATDCFRAHEIHIPVSCYPIESVTAFDIQSANVWTEVAGVEYLIGPQLNTIEILSPIGGRQDLARVRYVGGYVAPGTTPGEGQTPLPEDINRACIEQVVHFWQNKNRLGLTTVGGAAGSLSQFAELDLLPMVKNILNDYVRITI